MNARLRRSFLTWAVIAASLMFRSAFAADLSDAVSPPGLALPKIAISPVISVRSIDFRTDAEPGAPYTKIAAGIIAPGLKEGFAFAALVVVLLLRPQGLFGDSTSRAVAACPHYLRPVPQLAGRVRNR